MDAHPAKALEAGIKLEPVALQAGEVAVLPVPVAPKKKKHQGKAAEVDITHAGCVMKAANEPQTQRHETYLKID